MVHSYCTNQRMRYGPSSSRERHDDEAIRRAIQHSKESLRALSRRYGINQKTVRKWKARSSVVDRRTGPKEPRSTVVVDRGLSIEEEPVIVAFPRHTCCREPSRPHPREDCATRTRSRPAEPLSAKAPFSRHDVERRGCPRYLSRKAFR